MSFLSFVHTCTYVPKTCAWTHLYMHTFMYMGRYICKCSHTCLQRLCLHCAPHLGHSPLLSESPCIISWATARKECLDYDSGLGVMSPGYVCVRKEKGPKGKVELRDRDSARAGSGAGRCPNAAKMRMLRLLAGE